MALTLSPHIKERGRPPPEGGVWVWVWVWQMLTIADEGGRGLSQKLTIAEEGWVGGKLMFLHHLHSLIRGYPAIHT